MKQTLRAILLLLPLFAQAQLRESFTDGNITHSPPWAGDVESFVVNSEKQLQSNGPAVTGTFLQLITPSQAVTGTTWEFWANPKLSTSSGNYADVFLMASEASLNQAEGYFVRIGGTPDEVSLFRKDGGKSPVYLINGDGGTIGSSTHNLVRVRVSRDVNNAWTLAIDQTGTGQNYVLQGTATDATYQRSDYFGVLLKYAAASSQKFFFDDFTIRDDQPPLLEVVEPLSQEELALRFNEPLQPSPAQEVQHYVLNGSLQPTAAELVEEGTVRLRFGQKMNGGDNKLLIRNLADLYGNQLKAPIERTFAFVPPAALPAYNELLITEIMADETPAVGLPGQEYIELYNPTDKVLSLKGVRYSDATSTTVLPDAQLLPGEHAVVVPKSQVQHFSEYGKVIGISNFPSLNNSGELLQLRQPDGHLIYAVHYSNNWYKDRSKREGGWSLEMIDVGNPCAGVDNWTASTDPRGGTPAQVNAVAASNPDNTPPSLLEITALAPDKLQLRFNERLDSTQAAAIAHYTLKPDVPLTEVEVARPLFAEVTLSLGTPLQEGQQYTLTATGITDCSGNLSTQPLTATFALPVPPEPGDVVINEVLFNPRPNGVDFVELVNRSEKYLNLQYWQLASTSGDSIRNRKTITAENYVLAPGQYVVLTSDPGNVKMNYPAGEQDAFLKMSTLPSYPDEAGTVVLLQPDGQVADKFSYNEGMHFKLIDDVSGVSLERLRLEGPSIAGNFHSAATTVYATPGYKNSQSQEGVAVRRVFEVAPRVFSPDGDGYEDYTTINYHTDKTGLVANITIFDSEGRPVRQLVRNELLAQDGFFRWNGLREDGSKATIGYYLFYIELFGLNGEKHAYKEKVVLGGSL
ncbi:lamin tail-like protein [Pontibacter ummariensis]|uniref:Lamin Tail Domain n=1 Tax=Pontibacter ummariensis TaxID=1610492 RepID=A0A239HC29_9BACT|nr:lamin tail domain-containing protein [Pontibacter ummariensis]PRY10660.1 lamin tail-like protein [Pontibacter ummariensis]SNS78842.1 Lamin Tail Domain [Pontibacter ummariensis]